MHSRTLLLSALAFLLVGLNCQAVTNLVSTPTTGPTATANLSPTEPILILEPTVEGLDTPQEYTVPDEGRNHIELGNTASYDHYPPSSGLHYGRILEWGFYNEAVPPEFWVHSLEHGGIVILYNCPEGCKEAEDVFWDLVDNAPPEDQFNEVKILVSPNSQIETKVVALAWDTELDLDEADHDLLLDFYNRHANQGPELAP